MFTRRSGGKKNQDDTSLTQGVDAVSDSLSQGASQAKDQVKETSKGFLGKAAGLIGGGSDKSDDSTIAPTFGKPGLPEMPPLTPPGSVSGAVSAVTGGVAAATGAAGDIASKGASAAKELAGDAPRIPQRPSLPGADGQAPGSSMPSNTPRQAAAPKGGEAPRPPAPPAEPAKPAAAPPQPVAVAPSGPSTATPNTSGSNTSGPNISGPNISGPGSTMPPASSAGSRSRNTTERSNTSAGSGSPSATGSSGGTKTSSAPSSSATSDTSRRMPEPKAMTDLPTASSTPSSSATSSPSFGVADHGQLIVGKDIELNGKVKNCEILIVEGTVEATLVNTKVLEVAEGGVFRGTAPVETAEISGLVEGDLIVDGHVLVRSTGVVNGNIEFGELEIERGGRVHGSMLQFGEGARKKAAAAEARAAAKVSAPAKRKRASRAKKA